MLPRRDRLVVWRAALEGAWACGQQAASQHPKPLGQHGCLLQLPAWLWLSSFFEHATCFNMEPLRS